MPSSPPFFSLVCSVTPQVALLCMVCTLCSLLLLPLLRLCHYTVLLSSFPVGESCSFLSRWLMKVTSDKQTLSSSSSSSSVSATSVFDVTIADIKQVGYLSPHSPHVSHEQGISWSLLLVVTTCHLPSHSYCSCFFYFCCFSTTVTVPLLFCLVISFSCLSLLIAVYSLATCTCFPYYFLLYQRTAWDKVVVVVVFMC